MTTTLGQLADLVRGRLAGDPSLEIRGFSTLKDASPNEISFVDHPKLKDQIRTSSAGALVVPHDWNAVEKPTLHVDDVRQAFAAIVHHFRPPFAEPQCGISPLAHIHPSATIDDGANIHPYAVIGPEVYVARGVTIHSHAVIMGRCRIGEDTVIFPHAVLYRDTQVGRHVLLHSGVVLGAYGFGYDTIEGRHQLGAQLGYVLVEDFVEVGANTTIDRGSYGPTVIREGTKVDNQVMIAHNCQIGRHNLICSQVGVAGSSSTGDYVVMAGQVGVPDHVTIGHRAILGAKAGIMRDVPNDTTVIGIPATPERDQMAKQAAFAKLPEMRKQLRNLQRQVDRLEALFASEADEAGAQRNNGQAAEHPEAA